MKTLVKTGSADAEIAAALVLLCDSHPSSREIVITNLAPSSRYADKVLPLLKRGDFRGKFQETFWLCPEGTPAQRILLVGMHLPEEEKQHIGAGRLLQHAVAAAMAAARKLGVMELCFPFGHLLVKQYQPREAAHLVVEAAMLANYQFTKYLTRAEKKIPALASCILLCDQQEIKQDAEAGASLGAIAGKWINFARDLQNMPPNELTPEIFANLAEAKTKELGLFCRVLDEKEMLALGMGALLGVAQGSAQPPRFVIVENKGRPHADTLVLIGKGVTFDSGGLSLKPPESMEDMKTDMSGAAVVLSTMCVLAELDLALHVVGLMPLVENMPGATAQRPGDVVRACNGTTIEVADTDAEGRLILADALVYAARFKPNAIIDLATLTGTIFYVLGETAAGLFSNDQLLADRVKHAATISGERVWQLPLFPEFRKHLNSEIADIRNVSAKKTGGGASACAPATGGDRQCQRVRGADGRGAGLLAGADHARAVRGGRTIPAQHVGVGASPDPVSHGLDIASQWTDELDLEALRFLVSPKIPKRVAVDLGCGLGVQGIRFAVLGCRATLYDVVDIRVRVEQIKQALGISALEFKQIDLRQAEPEDFPTDIGLAYSQRFIHYLRFEESTRLLATLAVRLRTKARLFVSASGLNSELGSGYPHAGHPVEQRYAPLADAMQAKHGIREFVCLYTVEDLERAVLAHGFTAVRTWTSPFGNVKGIFERV